MFFLTSTSDCPKVTSMPLHTPSCIYHTAWASQFLSRLRSQNERKTCQLISKPTSHHTPSFPRKKKPIIVVHHPYRHLGHWQVNSAVDSIHIASLPSVFMWKLGKRSLPSTRIAIMKCYQRLISGLPLLTAHNPCPTPVLEWSVKSWNRKHWFPEPSFQWFPSGRKPRFLTLTPHQLLCELDLFVFLASSPSNCFLV